MALGLNFIGSVLYGRRVVLRPAQINEVNGSMGAGYGVINYTYEREMR
jgi:hypothetical protein